MNPFTSLLRVLLQPIIQEVKAMSATIQSKIDAETAAIAALEGLVIANNALLTTLKTDLDAALASAASAGATPDQLAAFDALTARIATATSSIQAADTASTPTPPPTPPPAA